jgi:hypothetical protein
LELVKKNDYEGIKVEVVPFVMRDFSQTPFGDWLAAEALKSKEATKEQISKWKEELERKTVEGVFLSYVNLVMVAGSKI